ncbi:MAG: porphobilinogen synthase [Candidatus Omnitrophota bacterium]
MRAIRLSRLRKNKTTRDWVSQTNIDIDDIIMPYFVAEGVNLSIPIASMPGINRFSIDALIKDISKLKGLRAILLFGVTDKKDAIGSKSYDKNGLVQKAVRAIKREFRDLIVITDVCLCGYTNYGHCGIIKKSNIKYQKSKIQIKNQNFYIDNDKTLKILAKIALSHAQAGVDFVAPSGMMDGQVGTIREVLDKNGFKDAGILAYSAKYASSFYGPFRDALDSAPAFGDRKSYQLDFRNSDEALREISEDIEEGADIVMVKPALAYLDIIYQAKQKFNIPLAAYNVSAEYAMLKKMSGNDEEKERELVSEVLTSIKRAGADFIITYHAKDIFKWLKIKGR